MGAHTEKQKVVGECHSTSQRAVAEGTLANLWVPQACALPQTGDPVASLGGELNEVAEAYRVWAECPCYRNKCQIKENINRLIVKEKQTSISVNNNYVTQRGRVTLNLIKLNFRMYLTRLCQTAPS